MCTRLQFLVIAATFFLLPSLACADDFLTNGIYMSQAIRSGDLPRIEKCLRALISMAAVTCPGVSGTRI
jgi:hypothetical protein